MRAVWVIDFEFIAGPGERPEPICCVAYEMISGRRVRLWQDELQHCPYEVGSDVLVVAYFATAEIGSILALGWPVPERLIDLFVEFSAITNGRPRPCGRGLLAALSHYGLSGMSAAAKDIMRERIVRGPPYTDVEREAILRYCERDVVATAALFAAMESTIASSPRRFNQALFRGRYVSAAAHMEHVGVPMDVPLWRRLQAHWRGISGALIDEIDPAGEIYDDGSFREARFRAWTLARGIAWPMLESGALNLEQATFRRMAEIFPAVEPIRQLRATLADLRACALAIGRDGRNRVLLSPLSTKTGRNSPSSTKFVFGASRWLRHLIRPGPGMALAYLDFVAQEIVVGAVLSGDERLLADALHRDVYLAFAQSTGFAPADATKATHGELRQRFKSVVLAPGYGQEAPGLSFRLQISVAEARHLLQLYAETYPQFAQWRLDNLNRALVGIPMMTTFGWPFYAGADVKPNTLRNWAIQSTAAEMLRLACCYGIERGVELTAPVHDAVLIQAPIDQIDEAVETMRGAMQDASRDVLGGVAVVVDTKVIRHPDCFVEGSNAAAMFARILKILAQVEQSDPLDPLDPSLAPTVPVLQGRPVEVLHA